ncbi:putative membrane protein, TIGR04086 family [Alteribacillus persepolensis]|uniref:Putative membrane protein, TIGR04086 family n=1 Tax=Alteribacillus persepolensis TaxID=568899 RepID=A0A1G8DHF5_9BACI|nr:TIGR04086 family membrane protein [Alteribacillus persepolensis]SDH57118.1 putative membrane protein, TIGR04086 family [Alteribacillus persepolensis]
MQRSGRIQAIGAGMAVIICLLIACAFIFSVLFRFTTVSEDTMQWLLYILAIISFGIGGIIAGIKSKEKGLITGVITAGAVICLIVLFQYLGYDSSITSSQVILFASFLISSAVGAAIGVNSVS